jgi:hypothetical protein
MIGLPSKHVRHAISSDHPLASLRLADRYKFKAFLSPKQQEMLAVATPYEGVTFSSELR